MKSQLRHSKSSGRYFGKSTIALRQSPRRPSVIRQVRRLIADLFPVTREPRIQETTSAAGDRRWVVYDPNRGYQLEFDSEQAVLEWLEEPQPPKSRFEQIWN